MILLADLENLANLAVAVQTMSAVWARIIVVLGNAYRSALPKGNLKLARVRNCRSGLTPTVIVTLDGDHRSVILLPTHLHI